MSDADRDKVTFPARGSRLQTRWLAPLALVVGLVYLSWRLSTGRGVHPALFWPLLGVEVFLWARLALRSVVTWELSPAQLLPARSIRDVDVVVAAYAEPLDVVRACLIGCREIRYPHRTWLVDDADRPELRLLAEEMGVQYVARPDPLGGRTGARNHVLHQASGELLLILDADQVPLPDAIHRVVGYFDKPAVAVVQTPLEYQNRDSILHAEHHRHERSLTNEVINPGRDHMRSAVWEGSSAMLRREAFLDIGGIPTSASTGELQATVKLQQAGWTVRYHRDVIAYGLAAHDLRALLRERARWARGHLAIVTTLHNPLWARGLEKRRRLAHVELLSDYFAAPVHLVGVAVLVATLLTGQLPLNAQPVVFFVLFGAWTLLASGARVGLGRGTVRAGETAMHSAITFQIHLSAIVATLTRIDRRFDARFAPRTDSGGLDVLRQLGLLSALTLILEFALAARLLDSLVGMPLPGKVGGLELVGLTVVCGTMLWFLLRVLGVFVRRRQYRASHRQRIDLPGLVEGQPAKILDANTRGASIVSTRQFPEGGEVRIGLRVIRVDGSESDLWFDGIVRSSVPNQHGNRWRLGCEFVDVDPEARDLLVEYLAVVRPFGELRAESTTIDA